MAGDNDNKSGQQGNVAPLSTGVEHFGENESSSPAHGTNIGGAHTYDTGAGTAVSATLPPPPRTGRGSGGGGTGDGNNG